MLAIVGTYQNGYVKFNREISQKNPVKVIITFLEDVEFSATDSLRLSDFSFAESRELLKNYKGSFSDTVIEERRKAI